MMLFREATAAVEERDELEVVAKALRKPSARARLGKANPVLRDASDQVLEALGLGGPFGQDLHPASVEKAVQAIEADGGTIAFDSDELSRLVHRPPPAPLGANGRFQPTWKALTVLQARNVTAALKNLMAAATSKNTAIVNGKRVERESLLAAMVAEAEENLPDRGAVSSSGAAEETIDLVLGSASAFDGDLLRIETMVRYLGGKRNTNSTWVQALIQPLRDAKHRETDLLKKTILPIVKVMDAVPEAMKNRLAEKVDGHRFFPHHTRDIEPPTRRFEILMMLLNMGNDSNKERLLKGRGITELQVLSAAKTLDISPAELAWVQAVWDSAESLWPMSRALEERDSGLAPPKIKASPITINGRTLRGGYFPAVYDRRVSGTGELQAGAALEGMMDPTYTRPGTHHSHLKKRAGRFDDIILLDPSVIQGHLWQVAHDIAFREAVRSVAGLLLDRGAAAKVEGGVEVSPARPALKDVLVQRLGEKRARGFLQWVKDVASNRGAQPAGHLEGDRILGHLRRNAARGLLGYAADVASGDLPNVVTAYGKFRDQGMPARHLVVGVGEFLRHPWLIRAAALEKSGELRSRQGTLEADWNRMKAALLRRRGGARAMLKGWDAFIDHAFVFFEITEAMTATPIWLGAYRFGIATGKTETEAVQHADYIVSSQLPPRHVMDMPAIMRSKGVMGGATFMWGYLSTLYNTKHDILHDGYLAWHTSEMEGRPPNLWKDSVALAKVVPEMAWKLFAVATAAHVLSGLFTGSGPEDEDQDGDRDLYDWWLWFIRKELSGLTLAEIPVLGPLAELAIGGVVTGRQVKLSVRNYPGAAVIQDLGNAAWKVAEGDETSADEVYKLLRALGVAGGVPTRPLRSANYARRALAGETEVRGPGDVLGGLIYGERWGDPANPFTAAQDLAE